MRKMCVVVQHHLGKGAAARPRCIPPAIALTGHRTHPEPAERITVPSLAGLGEVPLHLHRTMDHRSYRAPLNPTRKETSLSLHPSTWAAFLPPRPLTIPWRRLHRDHGREGIAAALPWNLPTEHGRSTPLATPTDPARVG